jgi:G3E family GTPase
MSSITPVTLLTGFLGSGKTTLLNRLLRSPALADTAVLINEYGNIAIDHHLVRESSDSIAVLANGCICCSVADDMVRTLRELYFKRANGDVPPFRRVIIETTGLADPAPIMHTLLEMPLVVTRFALAGVVTTLDVTHAMSQLAIQPESVKQIAVADRIVLTKCDLASAAALDDVEAHLQTLNPGALKMRIDSANFDYNKLIDTGLYQLEQKSAKVRQWLNAEAYRPVSAVANALSVPKRIDRFKQCAATSFCV